MDMKANRLVFDRLVDISPRTGVIKSNAKRMILASTEAMGFLRRDLIHTLGIERTKSVLLRYGWASGYNAAKSVKKMYPWRDKKELILAGPALHTIEGIAMVEASEIEVTDDYFYMRGSWHHSYEYEEHVRHFGYSDESVCWTLVGYVKGYLTCVYGKDIIVYEEECKGSRDAQCTFVACSVNHCPPEYLDSARYFEKGCLVTEFDLMFRELEQVQQTIQRADELGVRLTNAVLSGANLSTLLNYVSEELGLSVLIERTSLRKPLEICFLDENHQKAYASYSNGERTPVGYSIEVLPIKSEQNYYGKLVLIGTGRLKEAERRIAERSITTFLLYFYTQRTVAQITWQKKIDFFEQVLVSNYAPDVVMKMAKDVFDIDFDCANQILVIQSDMQDAYPLYLYLEKIVGTEVFMKNGAIIVMKEYQNKETHPFAKELLQQLEEMFPSHKIYIAVGRESSSLLTLGESYEEAFKLCNFLVHSSPSRGQVVCYEQLKHTLLFLKTAEPTELLSFYKQVIGKLIEYDEENDAELIFTLQTFFECNGNINKTAQQLNLSIPGFRYRMNKIETLVDVDLKTGDGRFQCQLALQFYYAVQAITISS